MTQQLMTEETPLKVLGLLGVALTSMFFLFVVSATNANFTQTEKPFPDPFSADKVVAALDYTASGYSKFIAANLVQPAQNSYAIYQYNLAYVIDNASPAILAYTGLTPLADVNNASARPQVAGAYTQTAAVSNSKLQDDGSFNIDTIYHALIR